MNKTIIININGTVFHIEEDAYEILKSYMTDVKRHFLNSADSLEITTDIENRIAEMFSEILARDNKQAIVEDDVKAVVGQMGSVEDFDSADDTGNKGPADNSYTYNTGMRRLFRDPEGHLISGLCAGIANYFNIQALWVRLAFVVLFFVGGMGLLLYIILWAVVPKASSRADRMAMKGEKLNLQGFKNNLEEELSTVRGHLDNLHAEARPVVYELRDFISDLFHHIGLFFGGAASLFVKFVGFVVLLAFFAGAIALVVALVAFVGFGAAFHNHAFPFTIVQNQHADAIFVTAFITAFIPVVVIIILLISAIFKTSGITRPVGTTILVLWATALCLFIFYVAKVTSNYRDSASFTETKTLQATPGNVYYLKLNDVKYLTHDDSSRLNIKSNFNNMVLTNRDDDDDSEPRNVNITIERSDIAQPVLVESFSARGRDYEDALMNARNTRYIFTQKDSVIKFDEMLRRNNDESWHEETLDLTLKLPLNAKVVIDRDLNDHVSLNGISVRDCNGNDKKSEDATFATFVMAADGLQCKIDTLVIVRSKMYIDSARRADSVKNAEEQ